MPTDRHISENPSGHPVTPHHAFPELAIALSPNNALQGLYFKREDLHPLGSHKGRSIPIMIDMAVSEGVTDFVISSSGNAALAAAKYIRQLNMGRTITSGQTPLTLEVLIGERIAPHKREKLDALKNEFIRVSMHERPLQVLFSRSKTKDQLKEGEKEVRPLRQSTDDVALIGYEGLARELLDIPDLRAVFIGTSSGTTAEALARFLKKNSDIGTKQIEVHIVQTTSCHPIADAFNEDLVTGNDSEVSLADAIVDHTALRKNKLVPLVESTGGSGWIATNESISTAIDLTRKHAGLLISPNSALSVAGLMNAIYTGRTWDGSVACMICGD